MAVLTDCCSSNTDDIQQSNLRDMANIGAFLLTSDDFLAGQEAPDLARQVQSCCWPTPTPPGLNPHKNALEPFSGSRAFFTLLYFLLCR